jgi:CheY-like chemotaxis protein
MPETKQLLVVDDDPAIREVLEEVLTLSDFEVDTACNGAEALDKVRQRAPDAVLLDLMMPIMDGPSFLQRCRGDHICDGLPVVVLSAAHDAPATARRIGARAFLPKPFEMDRLLETVEQVVN